MAGFTYSAIPVTGDALNPIHRGQDGFLALLSADGSRIEYSSYIWAGYTAPFGMALDGSGNVFLTGYTAQVDFPTTPGVWVDSAPNQVTIAARTSQETIQDLIDEMTVPHWGYSMAANSMP